MDQFIFIKIILYRNLLLMNINLNINQDIDANIGKFSVFALQ